MTRSTRSRIELLGVPERDLRLIAVVDDDQLDVFGLRRALQAFVDLAGEGAVLPLGGVADAVTPATPDLGDQAKAARVHLLQEPAVMEGVEEAEAHSLSEAGALPRRREGAEPRRRIGRRPGSRRREPPTARCRVRGPAWAWKGAATVSQSITRRAPCPSSPGRARARPEGRKPRRCVPWMTIPPPPGRSRMENRIAPRLGP